MESCHAPSFGLRGGKPVTPESLDFEKVEVVINDDEATTIVVDKRKLCEGSHYFAELDSQGRFDAIPQGSFHPVVTPDSVEISSVSMDDPVLVKHMLSFLRWGYYLPFSEYVLARAGIKGMSEGMGEGRERYTLAKDDVPDFKRQIKRMKDQKCHYKSKAVLESTIPLTHVKMFVLAEHYGYPALKDYAFLKLQVSMIWNHEGPDFADLIQLVYCGITALELRPYIVKLLNANIGLFMHPLVQMKIKRFPDLAEDLIRECRDTTRPAKRLDPCASTDRARSQHTRQEQLPFTIMKNEKLDKGTVTSISSGGSSRSNCVSKMTRDASSVTHVSETVLGNTVPTAPLPVAQLQHLTPGYLSVPSSPASTGLHPSWPTSSSVRTPEKSTIVCVTRDKPASVSSGIRNAICKASSSTNSVHDRDGFATPIGKSITVSPSIMNAPRRRHKRARSAESSDSVSELDLEVISLPYPSHKRSK